MPGPVLFISDLHLSADRPDKLQQFSRLMRGPALEARAVYILGDLFEHFWIGTDDRTPPNPAIINELRDCTGDGARLFFIRGNRELMITPEFEALTGCTLLPDSAVVTVDGRELLLMHGDLLCSRDRHYQLYRRFMDARPTRGLFLGLPRTARLALSRGLRPWMRRSANSKPPAIMDADQPTVERAMRQHAVSLLVHGHTHRPGIHDFELDGRPARRIVLGDWYEGDSVLVCSEGEYRLMSVDDRLGAGSEG